MLVLSPWVTHAQGAVSSSTAGHPPSVLIVSSWPAPLLGFYSAQALHSAGFNVNVLASGEDLTWKQVQPYNVLVLLDMGRSNSDQTLSRANQRTREVIKRFLARGGGVLYIPTWTQLDTMIPPQITLAKSWGLSPLFDELIRDPATAVKATAWDIDFARTQNIAASPATEGVKNLWYPAPATRIGAQSHSVPLDVDDTWNIVVRGAPSSYTEKIPRNGEAVTGTGTFSKAVPLVATKQDGPGRIVVLGIASDYLLRAHAATTLENIVLERGLQGAPSDGLQLLENSLHWLAQPSLAQGDLGGATMDPTLLENPLQTQFVKPYDWSKGIAFPTPNPAYPGVIGAQTTYSTGKATPDQWIAKAKAKGLSFIVFLEDFKSFSPEKLARLKDDCRRLSTPDFTAIPGFVINDEIGDHYFYFGPSVLYPDKKLLSADGKMFVSRDAPVSPKDPFLKGQLNSTVLAYAYSAAGFKLTAGNFLFRQSVAPFANFFGNYDATGVITSQNGILMEDATNEYLQLVAAGQSPLPLTITLMDNPNQLDNATWRTVLHLKPTDTISAFWDTWHFYPDNPTSISITNGPEIKTWALAGPRDYELQNQGNFVWQDYRWQVRGNVYSDNGLQEVAVYDGDHLFRHFLPQGKKTFAFTLDLTHNQQHNLVLIATDVQGKRAISRELFDRNHRLEEFQCSDRNNQLSYGYSTRSDGLGLAIGGFQALATPNKRVPTAALSPSGVFTNDPLLGAPAFDGTVTGEPAFSAPMQLRLADGSLTGPRCGEGQPVVNVRRCQYRRGTP